MKFPDDIQPGDCLLYGSKDLIDAVIMFKTWSDVAHIEVYMGGGVSVASRNGVGVGEYDYRAEGLRYILRPRSFDLNAARAYFESVDGQKYDWKGLLCFYLAVKQGSPNHQFCSEFATNLYRAAKTELFSDLIVADEVAPANFKYPHSFDVQYHYKLN